VWTLRETDTGFAPGERFWYSNDGYKLVGLVLEAVTGRPAHELVAQRVVAPLGMAATETTIRRDSLLPVATGYERRGDDRPAHTGRPLDVAQLVESCSADGSIVSSAADMLAYARLILNRGDAPGGRLLSEAAFERWSVPVIEDPDEPGSFYGYGLVSRTIDGYPCIGHSGGMVGFNSLLLTETETGLGVIVLLNGSAARRSRRHRGCGSAVRWGVRSGESRRRRRFVRRSPRLRTTRRSPRLRRPRRAARVGCAER
jgi:CubicO group peptidase (beta-lactamase class C family)